MRDSFAIGTTVAWDWGKGTARGKVRRVFREHVSRTIKGTEVTRRADDDHPAYLIEQDDGDEVLKSHAELRKAS